MNPIKLEFSQAFIRQTRDLQFNYIFFSGLLFHFLDELLFLFSAEPYLICKKLRIEEFDTEEFRIRCSCFGEPFDLSKHPQGTEVKAITYSAMQIVQNPQKYEIFVIIDI